MTMKDVPGINSKMLVKLGENDVKTVEDLAGCATDDLAGWTERKEGAEPVKHAGFLDGIDVSREDAEAPDHAGARQGGLDHRGRPRQADRGGGSLRRSAGITVA